MRRAFLTLLIAPALLAQAPLAPPTGLEASDGDYSTKVGMSWEHVRDAKLYRIFRSAGDDPATAQAVGETASIIFYDPTAVIGQDYFYWVRAENGERVSPFSAPDRGFRAQGLQSAFGKIGPLQPPRVPVNNPVTGAKVYLGKALFWDEQLSSTRTVSCGTCHLPTAGSSDPRARTGGIQTQHPGFDHVYGTDDDISASPGVPRTMPDGSYEPAEFFGLNEQVTERKSMPVFDAAYADQGLFWDGRAEPDFRDPITDELVWPDAPLLESQALESQVLGPFLSEVEMAHEGRDWPEVVQRVTESKPLALSPSVPAALAAWIGERTYPQLFDEAFGSPEITPVKIAMAVASYERTLYSDRAMIDKLVQQIIDYPEPVARGREVFFESFCDECHRGDLIGDNRFRFVGIRPDFEDIGRAEVTRKGTDRGRFRTATLRNVELRAPYMHTGGLKSLEEVVEFYNRGGDFDSPNKDRNFVTNLRLTDQEKSDLVAFLRSLTDSRAASEAAPLFDRPMLYGESERRPRLLGSGTPGAGGVTPRMHAIEPPLAGNPRFTVALSNAEPGVQAVLVIDETEPGLGPRIPGAASFFRGTVTTSDQGHGSLSLPIPNNPGLIGKELFGRWFVAGSSGTAVTQSFRIQIFAPPAPPDGTTLLSSVSAAALAVGAVAPDSIVSGFGTGLATATDTAQTLPLPTTLAGVSVTITDSRGFERRAPLFFVGPGQINYLVPAGTALGEATVSVRWGGAVIASGTLQVSAVAPSLFAANANGRDVAAAQILRVRPDGTRAAEAVARFDGVQGRFVPAPIDFGPEGDRLFLILFGAGVRGRGDAPVEVQIGENDLDVLFAGAHPEFAGLDQMNLELPRSLAGAGVVDVRTAVGDAVSNTVRLEFQ